MGSAFGHDPRDGSNRSSREEALQPKALWGKPKECEQRLAEEYQSKYCKIPFCLARRRRRHPVYASYGPSRGRLVVAMVGHGTAGPRHRSQSVKHFGISEVE